MKGAQDQPAPRRSSAEAGVANSGFWGIPVWPNTKYHASFYCASRRRLDRTTAAQHREQRRQSLIRLGENRAHQQRLEEIRS